MSLVKTLTPTNLLAEKEKFFADQSYNPQFVYRQPIEKEILDRYGQPQPALIDLAKEIVQQAYFHRNQQDLKMSEGRLLSQTEVTDQIETYLKLHNLEKRFKIAWSSSYVARTTITSHLIKIRLPVAFRQQGLMGMLYHEIGTHALRRINYEQQPWYKKKNKLGFSNYLTTEEGMASLHSLIPKTMQLAYVVALKYWMATLATDQSFSQLWQIVSAYISDPQSRWAFCVRLKRGMGDTGQPGVNSKSLIYFAGMIKVWQWLNQHNFDPSPLYWGKMAIEDVQKAVELNRKFEPALPRFYVSDPHKYRETIMKIGEINQFDQLTTN